MQKYVENDYAFFWVNNDVLHILYKENVSILLDVAMRVLADRLHIQQGKPYPILCNITGVVDMDKDARRFFASEGSVLIKALALISTDPMSHIFSRVYLNDNPPIQIKIFTEESRALEFLSQFVGPGSY